MRAALARWVSVPVTRRLLVLLARRLLVLLGVLVAVLAPAAPASAHAVLLHTDPGSGAVVRQEPRQVTLRFNEPVRLVVRDIGVVTPDGHDATAGRPRLTGDGSVLRIPLRDGLPKGTYLVTYRIISADSHPVAGGFSFSLGAPSKTAPATTGGTGATENPVVAVAMPVSRYLGFAGLVLLVGPVLVLISLWPDRLSRRGPARLVWSGAALIGFATIAEFFLQVPYSTGGGPFALSRHGVFEVLSSRFGWAHLVRLVMLTAAVPLLAILTAPRRNRLGVAQRVALLLVAAVGLGTWGYGGHPGTSSVPAVTVLGDAVHLGAMAVWLGGLVMLIGFLLPRGRPTELAAVLPVWSRWAGWAVGLLAAAGILQACLQLGTPAALVATTYGRLLIVKAVLLGVICVFASYSRAAVRRYALAPVAEASASTPVSRATTPVPAGAEGAADGDGTDPDRPDFPDAVWEEVYGGGAGRPPDSTAGSGAAGNSAADRADRTAVPAPPGPPAPRGRRLRRLVTVELAVAAVVLGVSAVLVQTTPARSVHATAGRQQNLPYSATLNSTHFSLQVQLDPARTGRNTLHLITFHRADGSPVRVRAWHATASLPSAGIGPVDIRLKPVTDNHAIGDIALPEPGKWKFTFTIRISDIDEDTVTTTVPVH